MVKLLQLSKKELFFLVKIMTVFYGKDTYLSLYLVLKMKMYAFFASFAGRTLIIPDRTRLRKWSLVAKVYLYIKDNNFSESSCVQAARKYGINLRRVRTYQRIGNRIIDKFSTITNKSLSKHIKK